MHSCMMKDWTCARRLDCYKAKVKDGVWQRVPEGQTSEKHCMKCWDEQMNKMIKRLEERMQRMLLQIRKDINAHQWRLEKMKMLTKYHDWRCNSEHSHIVAKHCITIIKASALASECNRNEDDINELKE